MTPRRVPAIMFQGTCSGAGKSLMTAAFCRILSDRGIRTAPFKAQNMSLNSYVTAKGGEIGRAQALQALAARTPPDVLMNPVLLKPLNDNGSQVILRGSPIAKNFSAREYYERNAFLRTEVQMAYNELANQFDAVVLEGAGSPGEVNLRTHDFVNMDMARHAKAPVILVGDIDRGGVYASFIGHLNVMKRWERKLLRGFLVNKFRGDDSLLKDAHDYLVKRTGKSVMGVMPYVMDHRLPEEDRLDFRNRFGESEKERRPKSVVGILALPHISNSTDIDPFIGVSNLQMEPIQSLHNFNRIQPSAVIIPGSKNVLEDMKHIRKIGLAETLNAAVQNNGLILVGICGGFQMLGKSIEDPLGVECTPGTSVKGLGLLSMRTVLKEQKTLNQTTVHLKRDGLAVTGYEIHHGETFYKEQELFEEPRIGCGTEQVWGTYLHGIFENKSILEDFIRSVHRKDENSSALIGQSEEIFSDYRDVEESITRFADIFRKNVDVDSFIRMMGF